MDAPAKLVGFPDRLDSHEQKQNMGVLLVKRGKNRDKRASPVNIYLYLLPNF
jgi:hypothetical protein